MDLMVHFQKSDKSSLAKKNVVSLLIGPLLGVNPMSIDHVQLGRENPVVSVLRGTDTDGSPYLKDDQFSGRNLGDNT